MKLKNPGGPAMNVQYTLREGENFRYYPVDELNPITDKAWRKAWEVEAWTADGKQVRAIFTGPDARLRAREYMYWMSAKHDPEAPR